MLIIEDWREEKIYIFPTAALETTIVGTAEAGQVVIKFPSDHTPELRKLIRTAGFCLTSSDGDKRGIFGLASSPIKGRGSKTETKGGNRQNPPD